MQKKIKDALKVIELFFDEKKTNILAFSGGKDSIVIYDLAKKVGLPIRYIHSNTTIAPPGHLSFIKENYPDVDIIQPKRSFYQLVERKGLPTSRSRFCCEHLKEFVGGKKSNIFEGTRIAESYGRKKRLSELKEPS